MAEQQTPETETWHEVPYFKPRGGEKIFPVRYLSIETLEGPTLPILADGFLALELREGTPASIARELAEMLNKHVAYLTYTGPNRPEWADQPGRKAVAERRRKQNGNR